MIISKTYYEHLLDICHRCFVSSIKRKNLISLPPRRLFLILCLMYQKDISVVGSSGGQKKTWWVSVFAKVASYLDMFSWWSVEFLQTNTKQCQLLLAYFYVYWTLYHTKDSAQSRQTQWKWIVLGLHWNTTSTTTRKVKTPKGYCYHDLQLLGQCRIHVVVDCYVIWEHVFVWWTWSCISMCEHNPWDALPWCKMR